MKVKRGQLQFCCKPVLSPQAVEVFITLHMSFTHGAANSHTSSVESQQTTSRSYITHLLSHSAFMLCPFLELRAARAKKHKSSSFPKCHLTQPQLDVMKQTNIHVFSLCKLDANTSEESIRFSGAWSNLSSIPNPPRRSHQPDYKM